ncbi:flagellar biosynthetic protein FliQ [Sphingomonas morindae]|uniref:Flagellar biosynthetic protein FliQ n=1 Tax=Sphingomonas morindae TaxID=1541170 RepID=A0ABY4X531_9SPHN|nr:flagellar biosynthetic protein FliQ [Sphingomonas morindae]USI72004.1 flagellar biosynthetic protein FliQ [Sphingomonas morindae]
MEAAEAMELARAALLLTGTVAGPLLLTSLIVGVGVGLVQALTQIQEATLTFVPKCLAMAAMLLLLLPMISHALAGFMARVADMIIAG